MEITLAESPSIQYGFYAIYTGTALIIAALATAVGGYWALALIPLLLYGSRVLRRDILRTADDAIIALRIDPGERLFVRSRDAGWTPCRVKSWWAGQRFILLALKCDGDATGLGSRPVAIDGSTLEDALFRELKVWLKGLKT